MSQDALIQILETSDPGGLTYAQIVDALSDKLQAKPLVAGEQLDLPAFSNVTINQSIYRIWTKLDFEFLDQTALILQRLIDKFGGKYPDGFLNLGIIHGIKGDYQKSIDALEQAIAQMENKNYPEARYQLGRILLESNTDLGRAVGKLNRATEEEPDNIPAYYFLGQAIRALVERETLVKAEEALKKYLKEGAPLGHEAEVQNFLEKRRAEDRKRVEPNTR